MNRRAVTIACVSVVAVLGAVFLRGGAEEQAYAAELVATCVKESSADVCYEREVPRLFDLLDVEEVFDVIREIRETDPRYQFCHVLAHKVGEHAVAADPDAWLSLVPLNPVDGLCSNGFIHGVIVGRFRDDVFDEAKMRETIPEFRRACEPQEGWNPSPLDQAICYHGMGHLFMFITDADYRRALDACAAIEDGPSGNFGRVCREGVFMQTYQPLEPDDFDLIELLPEKPERDNYRRICAQFERDTEEAACLREAWPLHRQEILDGSGLRVFCSGHPEGYEDVCYDTVFAIIGRMSQSLDKSDQIKAACGGAPEERRGLCFGTVAVAFIEENRRATDHAAAVCDLAPAGARLPCHETLLERMRFVYGSDTDGMGALCAALPDEIRSRCDALRNTPR